ncbi:MAG: aldehyde dehydrogenase [Rhodospirillales bacterium]|nr:aldehyde dehydrogenase [Rhodospirillales bacterium]
MKDFARVFIGGQWCKPSSDARLIVRSPATGEIIGSTPEAANEDIDRAIAAARTAFDTGPWPRMPLAERLNILGRVRDDLAGRLEELNLLSTRENGVAIAVNSAGSALAVLDFYISAAEHYAFEEQRNGVFGNRGTVVREPIGVVAAVTAWNGPLLQPMGKLAPALVTGCTVVLKPASETPLSSMALAEIFERAGLPPGVLSILPAGRDIGRHLVAHPGIDKVSFTGSTAAGREIAQSCGASLKKVTLELGGKSAAIVLDDAKLEPTSTFIGLGCMAYSGQACAALTRALVPRARYGEFIDCLGNAIARLKVGDPLDPTTIVGPLVAERQLRRVEDYIASGVEQGARIVLGGGRPAEWPDGWYIQPTLFADVDNGMRIAREEIFGPVLCAIPYDTEADAIEMANDNPYGLSGAVFGADLDRVERVARRLRTGSVGLNAIAGDVGLPFGGFKASGIGREFSIETLDHFTEMKVLSRNDAASFGALKLT